MEINNIFYTIHNFIVRLLTSFIFIKDVRRRVRDFLLVKPKENKIEKNPCQIGENTYLGSPVRIFHPKTVIGKYCSISWDVNIGTTHHPTNWLSTHIFQYSKRPDLYNIELDDDHILKYEYFSPVIIGNDVWVGCDVTIMDGIQIGDGAIIGAGSIVTKDVPPYAIVAGIPAKILRYRFDNEIIKELLELKWWDLDENIIKILPFDNVSLCIQKIKEIQNDNSPKLALQDGFSTRGG